MRLIDPMIVGIGGAVALQAQNAWGVLPPMPDHVVVVIEENQSYDDILGSGSSATYIKSLASKWAKFTESYALDRPSQPNYLDLFSGSNQGVDHNEIPAGVPFSTANLGAQLRAAGYSFTGYSENLPSVGSQVEYYSTVPGEAQYVRKHNPWSNWQADVPTGNRLPPSVNQPFTAFPTDYSTLPTVSFIVPDEQNDMHDGTITQGDTWLKTNLDKYYNWAMTHNSLLIVTFDEDDFTPANHIPTIFAGPMVKPGTYTQTINHFDVLRTLEAMYGLTYIGAAATGTTITNAFYPSSRIWLPGDANFTGVVTSVDFSILARNFGTTDATWDTGDFNGDGNVNAIDFNLLASHFGQTAPVPSDVVTGTAAPEPHVAVGLSGFALLRRRRDNTLVKKPY